jgi:ATP-dependent DNA helicase RecG
VDVPDATIMVVEHAERFGLAQLHQLRGRIGRGPGTVGRCFLLTPHGGGESGERASQAPAAFGEGVSARIATERLRVMATTTDGFRIAEADLALRGFGELFGTRQAGIPRLRFGDLRRDLELLALARTEAFALLEKDPDLSFPEHAALRAALDRRAADRVFGEEAG